MKTWTTTLFEVTGEHLFEEESGDFVFGVDLNDEDCELSRREANTLLRQMVSRWNAVTKALEVLDDPRLNGPSARAEAAAILRRAIF